MRFRSLFFSLLLSVVAFSCTAPSSVGNLDLVSWRNDRGGCKGERTGLENEITSLKKVLLGKSSNEIGRLFGAPDIHQLGGRNIKIYVYFLEGGPHCADKRAKSEALKVVFRFNAVSLLNEITIQREMPE